MEQERISVATLIREHVENNRISSIFRLLMDGINRTSEIIKCGIAERKNGNNCEFYYYHLHSQLKAFLTDVNKEVIKVWI